MGKQVKALSIIQPWASLLIHGAKQWETRSRRTRYRGPIAIHASKGRVVIPAVLAEIVQEALGVLPEDLPRGVVLGLATLSACERTEDVRLVIKHRERRLGDFSDGRFAYRIEPLRVFFQPVPARGALGLWVWEVPILPLPL